MEVGRPNRSRPELVSSLPRRLHGEATLTAIIQAMNRPEGLCAGFEGRVADSIEKNGADSQDERY